jgi:hypothetical protein
MPLGLATRMSNSDRSAVAAASATTRRVAPLLDAFRTTHWPGTETRQTKEERHADTAAWSAENAGRIRLLKDEDAKQLYDEVCVNVRTTDDISFKLLGFVPLVSGSGIVVLLNTSTITTNIGLSVFVGIFGAVVTFGLYRWELKNINLCHWLIRLGAELERERFHLNQGQFLMRHERASPPLFFGREFQKPQSERMIYWAAIIAWLSLPILAVATQ